MNKKKIFFILELTLIILIFIASSYFAQTRSAEIKSLVGNNTLGILIYFLVTIIAVVVAPITVFPLVPIAANIFGWFPSALVTILGWTIGGVIAFLIARRYGVPLVKKILPIDKIPKYESKVKDQNKFWGIVLLRMLIPVDLLSYALGLFSNVSLKVYTLATLIGVIPFTLIYSYAGTVNMYYQLITLGIFLILILIRIIYKFVKHKN